ncbi:MAG TPA: hypothetical protein VJA21_11965 [Verrucomicrobiae bacterium]
MTEPHAIHVVLQSWDGKYLAGQTGAWSFSDQIDQARVFDYIADRIPEQLEKLEQGHGISLAVLPLDPRARFETCDRCGERMMAFRIYFDGKEYLCPECRP